MKTLYHYTSIERWGRIKDDGRLNTTDSCLVAPSRDGALNENRGPSVVWLTTDGEGTLGHGLQNTLDRTDKTRVRVTVQLPNNEVHKWKDWALRRRINPRWLRSLTEDQSGASTWRITERPIPSTRWVEVVDLETGEQLFPVIAE